MDADQYQVEARGEGVVLVRVRSPERDGQRPPDAVFTFRPGDPQYDLWASRAQPQRPSAASPRS